MRLIVEASKTLSMISLMSKISDIKCDLGFMVNAETYDMFKEFYTMGYHEDCDIVYLNDSNIEEFKNKKIKNAMLFINDESKLYDNFVSIYKNVIGFIEFKVIYKIKDFKVLEEQLEKISDLIIQEEQNGSNILVKQLTGFKIKEKFNKFGEEWLFLGSDEYVYYSPEFFYDNDPVGRLCKLDDFDVDKENFHFTQPHLICVVCECFYCDRNIHNNKKFTGEFKTPSSMSCKINTLFNKYSFKIFNTLMKSSVEPLELDRVSDFNTTKDYEKFLSNKIFCNNIKKVDYSKRRLCK